MFCENCGEQMCGDGYSTAFHCIWAQFEKWAHEPPDVNPIYCTEEDWEEVEIVDSKTTKMYMLTEEEVLAALAAYCKTDAKLTKVFFFRNDEDQPIDNLAGCQLIEEKE